MSDSIPNIWLMQTQRDTAGLVKALRHPDASIRRRVAAAIRVIGDETAIDGVQDALDAEKDEQVKVALKATLDHLTRSDDDNEPSKDAVKASAKKRTRVERMIQALTGKNDDYAIRAARELAKSDDRSAVAPLIMVFKNPRKPPAVRLAAANALLDLNSPTADITLLGLLRSEKPHLRRNGAAILGKMQAEWAVEPLTEALNDPHEVVAKTARAALRNIGTPEAQRALNASKQAILAADKASGDETVARKKQTAKLIGNQVKVPRKSAEASQFLVQNRRRGTNKLDAPKPKVETGVLKRPVVDVDEADVKAPVAEAGTGNSSEAPTTMLPPMPPTLPEMPQDPTATEPTMASESRPQPPEKPVQKKKKPKPPPKPSLQVVKRKRSRKRKSATRRLDPRDVGLEPDDD